MQAYYSILIPMLAGINPTQHQSLRESATWSQGDPYQDAESKCKLPRGT